MAGAGGAGVRVCGGFFLRVFVGGRGRERGQWKERKREKAVAVEGKAKACGGFGLGWGGGGGGLFAFHTRLSRGAGLRLGASRSPYLRNQSKPVRERVVFSAVWWDFESSEHVGTWEGSRDENSHI